MQTTGSSIGKGRKIAGTVIIVLGALMLLAAGTPKLLRIPQVVEGMGAMGFDGGKVLFVGLLVVGSALLFLIPATRSIGLLLVSSFLGGAIATHLQHGQSIAGPSILLVAMWTGAALRHPEICWSRRCCAPAGSSGAPQG